MNQTTKAQAVQLAHKLIYAYPNWDIAETANYYLDMAMMYPSAEPFHRKNFLASHDRFVESLFVPEA